MWEPLSLDPSDQRWMYFITSQQQASLFHHPVWINLIAESYAYRPFVLVVVNKHGEIEAGVPLMEVKVPLSDKRWVSLPFTDHCTPLYNSEEALKFLAASLFELSHNGRIRNVELRWIYPSFPEIQTYSDFVLTRLNLTYGEHQIASQIKPKHFRQIKVAYQRGVRIESGNDVEHLRKFYSLHLQTRRRLGIPIQPWSFFKRMAESILESGYGFVLLAYKEKVCVAAAVFLHWNRTLIYKYSASTKESRHLLAMDPILWTAICWGCERDFHWMDMGRTNQDEKGLRNFKLRWGAEELPLLYSASPVRSESILQSKLMPLMQTIIKKSPLWVCRLAGELFYRYFG